MRMRQFAALLFSICCGLANPANAINFEYIPCPNTKTLDDPSLRLVAKVIKGAAPSAFIISVNPKVAYDHALSPQTVRWLHARECAHIIAGHLKVPTDRYTIRQEQEADNLAIQKFCETSKIADREIRMVERDIKRVIMEFENRGQGWPPILGERRTIDVLDCNPPKK